MYLTVPDESAPIKAQTSQPGWMSSVGAGIHDWLDPYERLWGVSSELKAAAMGIADDIPISKDDYQKSYPDNPHGWYDGMTQAQASVLNAKFDRDQRAAEYASQHPIKAFVGSSIGNSLNPLWWIGAGELAAGPVLFELGEGAVGKVAEAGVATGIQAAGITALEQGANELTGHEADPWAIIKNFATGLVLSGAAHGIHLALRPQVAAMQDIADSVESGKPLDAANKVFPESPESAAEEIPSETTVLETPPKTLYRSSQGGDIWTEDIERAKSYPGHLQAITVPADVAESLRTTAGSEAGKAARAAGHQPTTTDFWLGGHPELTKAPADSAPNTMPVGGHKPVIEAATGYNTGNGGADQPWGDRKS